MHVIKARNVNHALHAGLIYIKTHGIREETRAGPALVSPVPVTTVYERPAERVLFSPIRDANPFFHLAEAMWMLEGRGDAAFLDHFIPSFGERFAESDGMIHGAYGRRWRNHFVNVDHSGDERSAEPYYIDQLSLCIDELRHDPASRQVVLTMWDPEVDLARKGLKDRPCNTQVYFRIRQLQDPLNAEGLLEPVLDMTVLCRSNDLIMGAYGANAVHFSVLQEYVAGALGVEVGTYYQISNNFHAYVRDLDMLDKRHRENPLDVHDPDIYQDTMIPTTRLMSPPGRAQTFREEVRAILDRFERGVPLGGGWTQEFLNRTFVPMLMAHTHYRAGDFPSAMATCRLIGSWDWQRASREWIARRSLAKGAAK